jgi:hypothetical protein
MHLWHAPRPIYRIVGYPKEKTLSYGPVEENLAKGLLELNAMLKFNTF